MRASITASSLTVRSERTNGARSSARCCRRNTNGTVKPEYSKQSRVPTLQVAKDRDADRVARKGGVGRLWLQGLLLRVEKHGAGTEHQSRLVPRGVPSEARGNREFYCRARRTAVARASLEGTLNDHHDQGAAR